MRLTYAILLLGVGLLAQITNAQSPDYLWHFLCPRQSNLVVPSSNGDFAVATETRVLILSSTGNVKSFIPTNVQWRRPSFDASGSKILTMCVDNGAIRIELWNANTGALIKNYQLSADLSDTPIIPGTNQFLYLSSSRVRQVDLTSGSEVGSIDFAATIISPSRTGAWIAMAGASSSGTVRLYSYPAKTLVGTFVNGSAVKRLAVTNDGKYVISSTQDGVVRIWDVATQSLKAFLSGEYQANLTPDGQRIVTSSPTRSSIRVYQVPSGTLVAEWPLQAPAVDSEVTASGDATVSCHAAAGYRLSLTSLSTGQSLIDIDQGSGVPDFHRWSDDGLQAVLTGFGKLNMVDGAYIPDIDVAGVVCDWSTAKDLIVSKTPTAFEVQKLSDGSPVISLALSDSNGERRDAAFSKDGTRLFMVGRKYTGFSYLKTWVFNTTTWTFSTHNGSEDGNFFDIHTVLPNDEVLIGKNSLGRVAIVNFDTGAVKWIKGSAPEYGKMYLKSDLTQYAYASGRVISFRSMATGDLIRQVTIDQEASVIEVSPDFSTIVAVRVSGADNNKTTVSFHAPSDGQTVFQWDRLVLRPADARITPDGIDMLLFGSSDLVSRTRNPMNSNAISKPTSIKVKLGKIVSGDYTLLGNLDGLRLTVQKFFVPTNDGPSIQVEVEAISPYAQLQKLSLDCVAKMDSAGQFEHKIELWDFAMSRWDPTDINVTPLTTTQKTMTLSGSGNLARYVEPVTKKLRARYTLTRTGQTAAFNWATIHDQFAWYISGE